MSRSILIAFRYMCCLQLVIYSALKIGKISKLHVNKMSLLNHLSHLFTSYRNYFSSCLRFLKREKQSRRCSDNWYGESNLCLKIWVVSCCSCVTLVLVQPVTWTLSLSLITVKQEEWCHLFQRVREESD